MNKSQLLFRQIHPSFIQKGMITSQAFVPTPKDELKLSCYNGNMISAEDAFRHFTEKLNQTSSGVLGVSFEECLSVDLTPVADADPFPEHAHIPFHNLSSGSIRKIGQKLRDYAINRGWLFQP
jgi:hypothetical protein